MPNPQQSNLPASNQPAANPEAGKKNTNTTRTILVVVLAIVLVLLGLIFLRGLRRSRLTEEAKQNNPANLVSNVSSNTVSNQAETNNAISNTQSGTTNTSSNTSNAGKEGSTTSGAPVLVSSTPASGATVAESSVAAVSVSFDRALDVSSTLSVTKESLPYRVGAGVTSFSSDKKTMMLAINSNANSVYTVHYTACTSVNTNCTTGSLSFVVGTVSKTPSNMVR